MTLLVITVHVVDSALPLHLQLNQDSFKSRQGPPSEFAEHQLPLAKQVTQSSDSALMTITLQRGVENGGNGVLYWKGRVPVDSNLVSFSLLSVLSKHMTLKLVGEKDEAQVVDQWFGINEHHGISAKTYQFDELKPGLYNIEITCPDGIPELSHIQQDHPHLQLLMYNESPVRVYSHLMSYKLQVNQEIGVQASLVESKLGKTAIPFVPAPITLDNVPNPSGLNSFMVDMDVIMPDGQEKIISMHDDGMHMDENARDGVWGATIKATEAGKYVVQVVMRAQIDMNKPGTPVEKSQPPMDLLRTSQHVVHVVDEDMELLPKARTTIPSNEEMIDIVLTAKPLTQNIAGTKFNAYAEVWGTNSANGELVPVAWISGMTVAEKLDDETVAMKLKLSGKWLSQAKASLPLKLRNAYVLDVDNSVPLSTIQEIDVDVQEVNTAKRLLATHPVFAYNGTITETMKVGKRPLKLLQSTRNAPNAGHRVLLVHGYCTNSNPFSTEDFTNFAEFLDSKQSRSHDEFAQLIAKFGEEYSSISVVAHSQGGSAALHLLNNYWSHMDNAKSTEDYRVIQSVGTPYGGSGLAGTLASIGSVFDVGCGSNTDLTHDGSKRWLPTISADAQKNVYYYTSQYKPNSWCNLGANFVLEWPNDGTTEYNYAKLEHGNAVAHLTGYCHTEGMKYPPQCQNHEQNQQINSFAHP
jgi:hypothetical protein